MPKQAKKTGKKKKVDDRIKKKLNKQNIDIVDTDSDALVNDSETQNAKVPTSIAPTVSAISAIPEQTEAPEQFEEAPDSEVEDEDKLDEDVEVEEEEEEEPAELSDVTDEEAPSAEEDEYKEKCLYKHAEEVSEDEYDDIQEEFFSDDKEDEVLPDRVPDDERTTKPRMTKYEKVRLLGIRTRQIALGAKPMIKNTESLSSKQIAELELKENTTPLIIIRPLPNGRKEYWKVSELEHEEEEQ
jgi:DNA-directed RNA polymerase I, II, and III subunit RPABC2